MSRCRLLEITEQTYNLKVIKSYHEMHSTYFFLFVDRLSNTNFCSGNNSLPHTNVSIQLNKVIVSNKLLST